jgi:hypothetical protein
MRLSLLAGLILIALSGGLNADYGFEVQIGQNFTGNLLLDSSGLYDSYSNTNLSFDYYPLPFLKANLKTEYTYYSKLTGLGNLLGGGGITLIPTSAESPLSVYLTANFTRRSYRTEFKVYNTDDYDFLTSLGYQLSPAVQIRTGISYKNMTYIKSDVADKESYEIFAGANLTVFGSNSLDLEAGYSRAKSKFIDSIILHLPPDPTEIIWEDENLKSFYISPRFSRTLGLKTGMNITFTYTEFLGNDDLKVMSYQTGFLSPWASVWEGNSVSANLKSYLIPNMIVSLGGGYWNKTFLKMFEFPDRFKMRDDDLSRYYLSISRPIATNSGLFFEPSLQLDISNCTSTHKLYDYSSYSIVAGLTIRK